MCFVEIVGVDGFIALFLDIFGILFVVDLFVSRD